MRESLKGKVIRIHSDDGHADFGRIIYDFVENDDVLYIAFPSSPEKTFGEVNSITDAKAPKNEKRRSAYLGMPRRLRRATLPLWEEERVFRSSISLRRPSGFSLTTNLKMKPRR